MVKMVYNEEKKIYQFGDDYIDEYVDTHVEKSSWKEPVLKLFLQTVVYAIDSALETYKDYPGSAYLLLSGLYTLNNHYLVPDENYDKIKKEFIPKFFDMGHGSNLMAMWTLPESMTPFLQFCNDEFIKLRFWQLQDMIWISSKQKKENHQIIAEHLKEALDCIKQSPTYQEAERTGHLYITPWMPADQPQPSHSSTQAPNFFQPPLSKRRKKDNQQTLSRTAGKDFGVG